MKCACCGHSRTYHALTVPDWAEGWEPPYQADGHCFYFHFPGGGYCKCEGYKPKQKAAA